MGVNPVVAQSPHELCQTVLTIHGGIGSFTYHDPVNPCKSTKSEKALWENGCVTYPTEDHHMKCERCENEGAGQVCGGDGRYHHHGHVHTYEGGLEWLCDECAQADREQWTAAKLLGSIERAAVA